MARRSSALVKAALEQHLRRLESLDEEEPFFVASLDHIRQSYAEWRLSMMRIRPYYAVKCNPDCVMLQQLRDLGTGFDCASPSEIGVVLGLGVPPDAIIYAHPCKSRKHIRYARDNGVEKMTFDNAAELYKIAAEYPSSKLVLRILADDETAICRLGQKFGASVNESRHLLHLARKLRLNVVGISFHVGSGARDVNAFKTAIRDARRVWDYASCLSFDMQILDIGGGFTQKTLKVMAGPINEAIERHFGDIYCEVIAEPGRYFAEGAYTLACSVIAKRVPGAGLCNGANHAMLYLNDGVYGSFSTCIYEKAVYTPKFLRRGMAYHPTKADEQDAKVVLWGPTCDSEDVINKHCVLPCMPDVGDWLYFENLGGKSVLLRGLEHFEDADKDAEAYSIACSTEFNGFDKVRNVIYVDNVKPQDRKDSAVCLENDDLCLE